MTPPSVPGTSWFLSRMLANVPRIITSWLPRRAPYWLKSFGCTPRSWRYLPAGLSALMLPAGEMWSVVMLSPRTASTRAPEIGCGGGASRVSPSKYGGFRTYVDASSHANRSPAGGAMAFHRSSPSNTPAYTSRYISAVIDPAMHSWISRSLGQMSFRYTGAPALS